MNRLEYLSSIKADLISPTAAKDLKLDLALVRRINDKAWFIHALQDPYSVGRARPYADPDRTIGEHKTFLSGLLALAPECRAEVIRGQADEREYLEELERISLKKEEE